MQFRGVFELKIIQSDYTTLLLSPKCSNVLNTVWYSLGSVAKTQGPCCQINKGKLLCSPFPVIKLLYVVCRIFQPGVSFRGIYHIQIYTESTYIHWYTLLYIHYTEYIYTNPSFIDNKHYKILKFYEETQNMNTMK